MRMTPDSSCFPAVSRRAARGALLATMASAVAVVTACGSSTSGGSSGGVTTGANPPPAGETGNVVTVAEKEFSIQLSETSVPAGTYTFRVQNQGTSPHDLSIKGPGMDREASPVINGGETTDLTVTLHPGTYQVWCSVDNHRVQGMDTTLTVS